MLPNGDGEYRIRNLNRETIHTAGDTVLSINERGLDRGNHRVVRTRPLLHLWTTLILTTVSGKSSPRETENVP